MLPKVCDRLTFVSPFPCSPVISHALIGGYSLGESARFTRLGHPIVTQFPRGT